MPSTARFFIFMTGHNIILSWQLRLLAPTLGPGRVQAVAARRAAFDEAVARVKDTISEIKTTRRARGRGAPPQVRVCAHVYVHTCMRTRVCNGV